MAPSILKKRKHEAVTKPKAQRPIKKFKKQAHYSSSSSSSTSADEAPDFPPIDLAESDSETGEHVNGLNDDNASPHPFNQKQDSASSQSTSASDSDASSSSASITTSNPSTSPKRKKPNKRNDPSAFATSISSILSSKLPNQKRSDPVLARSSTAQAANTALREAQLEKRARQQIRAEKKALMEKGRVKDVLLGTVMGVNDGDIEEEEGRAAKIMEQERRLKKTAQRGVVKLFNAVRMAQVRGEEARREALEKGVVGSKRKEERVGQMSKKGFLELVASGGGKAKSGKMSGETIEEA
ncbi:MAG: hypothetical protein Q9220_005760 [cf. Caloplaca sp. 1 TL-2023]